MATERSHLQRCMAQDCAQPGRVDVDVDAEEQACPAQPELTSISLEAEVPEALFDGMRQFLEHHPQWDQYQLISSALAGFLFQNGCGDQGVTQHYLNGLFLRR